MESSLNFSCEKFLRIWKVLGGTWPPSPGTRRWSSDPSRGSRGLEHSPGGSGLLRDGVSGGIQRNSESPAMVVRLFKEKSKVSSESRGIRDVVQSAQGGDGVFANIPGGWWDISKWI